MDYFKNNLMKQALLIFVFGLLVNMTFAQGSNDCSTCGNSNQYPSYGTAQTASFSEQQSCDDNETQILFAQLVVAKNKEDAQGSWAPIATKIQRIAT